MRDNVRPGKVLFGTTALTSMELKDAQGVLYRLHTRWWSYSESNIYPMQCTYAKNDAVSARSSQMPMVPIGSTEMFQGSRCSSQNAFTAFPIEFHDASFNASKHAFTSKNALMHLAQVKGGRKSSLPVRYYQSPCKLPLNIIESRQLRWRLQSRNV